MSYYEEHNLAESEASGARGAISGAQDASGARSRAHQTLSSFLTGSLASGTHQTSQELFSELVSGVLSLDNNELYEQLQGADPAKLAGASQEFIDSLERVNVKSLKASQACAICTNDFLDDPHPLVVRLPCDGKHKFDLECIAPWLKVNATCPMCRKDVLAKKEIEVPEDSEEEHDWDMYG